MFVFPLLPQKAPLDEVKKWMARIDTNRDGVISDQELEKALRELNVWFVSRRTERGMKRADLNCNGKIDTDEEMQQLLEHAQKHWGRAIHSLMVESN